MHSLLSVFVGIQTADEKGGGGGRKATVGKEKESAQGQERQGTIPIEWIDTSADKTD